MAPSPNLGHMKGLQAGCTGSQGVGSSCMTALQCRLTARARHETAVDGRGRVEGDGEGVRCAWLGLGLGLGLELELGLGLGLGLGLSFGGGRGLGL